MAVLFNATIPFWLLLCLLVQCCDGQACPNEWTSYEGSCYVLGTETLTWPGAEEICRDFQSNLVSIGTSDENEFIKRLLNNHNSINHVWVGGTDIFDEGNFVWVGSREPFEFADWSDGEPNNYYGTSTEDCVQMRKEYKWTWNDEKCTSLSYFVCEKSLGGTGEIIG